MTTAGGRDPSPTADLQRARSAELQVVNKTGAGGQDPSLTDDKRHDNQRPGPKPHRRRQEARTQASQTTTGGQDPSLTDEDLQ